MPAPTRTPAILVKLQAAPEKLALSFRKNTINVAFEKLFSGITPKSTGPKAAAPPEWYLMSARRAGPEVNPWDLCHSLVTEGLGISGSKPAQFAEPDLEQQWITATPAQHAMSLARPCATAVPFDK